MEFYVFNGTHWLADDEHSWTTDFGAVACFTSAKLATEIAERETNGGLYFVLQLVTSDGTP